MNNESIKEVEDFIQAYLAENDIMMKKLLGLSPDINLDDEENERLICDAIDNLVCGTEERREYFYRRIEGEKDTNTIYSLAEILSYTNQFDKIKEFLDREHDGKLRGVDFNKSLLLEGLARSPEYHPFIEELLCDRNKALKYFNYPDFYVTSILSKIDDLPVVDSFIKENAQRKNDSNGDIAGNRGRKQYELNAKHYIQIIQSTKNSDYIKKCFYNKELCDSLGFGYHEKVALAISSKDSKCIEECLNSQERASLTNEEISGLYIAHENEAFVIDSISDATKHGIDEEILPTIIMKRKISAEKVKDLPIFKSEEGKIALSLYEGKSSAYDSNYKLQDIEICLPEDMTIGIEIESTGFYSELIHGTLGLNGWEAKNDGSITNNEKKKIGVEVVSPVLSGNTQETTKSIIAVTETLKSMGQYTNDSCGGHIHIGANYLKSEQAFRNLFELWNNNEKILYIISNKAGELPRFSFSRYAEPISQDAEENIGEVIKLSDENDLEKLKFNIAKKQEGRYKGINFKNLGTFGKDTVEFRLSNGTIDSRTWIENVNLFGGLVKTAQDLAEIQSKNPEDRTQEEAERLAIFDRLGTDNTLSEAERAELLIKLVIQEDKSRPIYMERYKINRELLNQNPELEEEIDEKVSHSLIRYSDKNIIGKRVFTGSKPVTGMEMGEIGSFLQSDRMIENTKNFGRIVDK